MPWAESPLAGLLPLAYGDLSEQDTAELQALKQQVSRAVDFPCASYKEKCLRRRIAVRMRACRAQRYGDYAHLLEQDPEEYQRLVDALTVHVSKFFRNPEVWAALEESVLPELCRGRTSPLRVWSAGCAAGEEPFSASILLQQLAPAAGFQVLGSDISAGALRAAAVAEYSSFALTDTSPAVCERWFAAGPPYRLRPEACRPVSFVRADLLSDPPPREQDLVLCRNVLIYLEVPQQEQLLRSLHESLAPGGFLVLGKVETPSGVTARRFAAPHPRLRIFRKQ